jgi:hypothetical protein
MPKKFTLKLLQGAVKWIKALFFVLVKPSYRLPRFGLKSLLETKRIYLIRGYPRLRGEGFFGGLYKKSFGGV